MAMNVWSRAKNAWNAFRYNRDPTRNYFYERSGTYHNPAKLRLSGQNERSILASVYNKIALDVAQVTIWHVDVDERGRFLSPRNSELQRCLTIEANIDQSARAYTQDLIMSMFDEGEIASVPIDTTDDPNLTDSYDIGTLRRGKIIQWYPDSVKMEVYNDRTGQHQEIIMKKRNVAILENPLYAVMNAPNSTLKRLNRKLNLLDAVDEQSSSGKLDLIIQLPYTIKTESRRNQADLRRKQIEDQLAGSKYGIAYTDGTEKITQLNRPVENNLLHTIEYLTSMLYGQLGITQEVLDGSASEQAMINYNQRTVEPIVSVIVDEYKRKFLSRTAMTRGQSIMFFMNYFKLVPFSQLADLADKMTRNEIMSSNEWRQILGLPPSDDPDADELRNKNLNKADNMPDIPNGQLEKSMIDGNLKLDDGSSEKGE